ncbi:MFS transporter [Amycolatopsis sp. GM8]|uniref:MFS transporter n=1 Tax=Amycolatopsis sp. GM8 TaxID=2896530 RepID=UPI001EFF6610|nr:MFS transporter [Amycolatopsis sp. GM8]
MDKATEHRPDEVAPPVLRRAVAAAAIGNATEWYDYGVYGYVAVEIGKNFFPGPYSTLATLLVFAVSFVLRPLGGLVWGPLGDRIGRNRVLATTIVLMSLATFLIGVLPTYASIGVWAPILLVLLRIVQGFSTGGEYGGAATFMAEYAPDKKRGFWGSFLEFGTLTGVTFGVLLVLILNKTLDSAAMSSWGWRIPFFVALPLGLVGLYLRRRVQDTPVFHELVETGEREQTARRVLPGLLRHHWPAMLRLGGIVIALNITAYIYISYMPTYLQKTIGLSKTSTSTLLTIAQVAMLAVIPLAGALSDRIGRKPIWWISLTGTFVLAAPMFWLMGRGFALALVGFTVLGLVYVLQLGTISATFPAMFPAHVRYSGMATSYNVATAAFGGTAPFVAAALVDSTGNKLMPAFYLMAACLIAMIALIKVPETVGSSLRGRTVPGVAGQDTTVHGGQTRREPEHGLA